MRWARAVAAALQLVTLLSPSSHIAAGVRNEGQADRAPPPQQAEEAEEVLQNAPRPAEAADPAVRLLLQELRRQWFEAGCAAEETLDLELRALGAEIEVVEGYALHADIELRTFSPASDPSSAPEAPGIAPWRRHRFFAEISAQRRTDLPCDLQEPPALRACLQPNVFISWPGHLGQVCDLVRTSTYKPLAAENEGEVAATSALEVAGNAVRYRGGVRPASEMLPLILAKELKRLEDAAARKHRDVFAGALAADPREEASAFDPRRHPDERWRRCFPGAGGNGGVRSQGSCGSCWVFAGLGMLGDRLCITNAEAMTEQHSGKRFLLSAQQVLSCNKDGHNCAGGNLHYLDKYLRQRQDAGEGLHLERAYPYTSRCAVAAGNGSKIVVEPDFSRTSGCTPFAHLGDDDPEKPCACVERRMREVPPCDGDRCKGGKFAYKTLMRLPSPGIPDFALNEEVNRIIRLSLFVDGPAYATFDIYADFQRLLREHGQQTSYVYECSSQQGFEGSHAVVLIGWGGSGKRRDPQFWHIRNSWGKSWGIQGHFKMLRGANACNVESDVHVAIPKAPTRTWNLKLRLNRELTGRSYLVYDCVDGDGEATECAGVGAGGAIADLRQWPEFESRFEEELRSLDCCCDKVNFLEREERQLCKLAPKSPQIAPGQRKRNGTAMVTACGLLNFGRGHVHMEAEEERGACAADERFLRTNRVMPLATSAYLSDGGSVSDFTKLRVDLRPLDLQRGGWRAPVALRAIGRHIALDEAVDEDAAARGSGDGAAAVARRSPPLAHDPDGLRRRLPEAAARAKVGIVKEGGFVYEELRTIAGISVTFPSANVFDVRARCSKPCSKVTAVLIRDADPNERYELNQFEPEGELEFRQIVWQRVPAGVYELRVIGYTPRGEALHMSAQWTDRIQVG